VILDLDTLRTQAEPLQFITEEGIDKTEGLEIAEKLKAWLDTNPKSLSVSAPQLGINKRVVCLRFDNEIKTFYNPVVIKKDKYSVAAEIFNNMPGKEILIARPEEATVVYHNADFTYEENKFLGLAARLLDQHSQLFEGVLPDELGLVSDIETDGSLFDLTEEELSPLLDIYSQFITAKTNAFREKAFEDAESEKIFKNLKFTEDVINGRTLIVDNPDQAGHARAEKVANKAIYAERKLEQQERRASLRKFLSRKGKK
jgi:peptide deformylase